MQNLVGTISDGTLLFPIWFFATLTFLVFWELIWKGLGLYKAGKRQQPIWFIFMLILNTAGILPIIYLLISNKKIKKKK